MAKVKVHKLAKDFGFKSAEFVEILRNIGFPVTSYQASVEEWDVPIIEERLIRGGLIESDESSSSDGGDSGDGGGGGTSWADLQKLGEQVKSAPAPEEEPAAEEQPAEEPAPAEVADEEEAAPEEAPPAEEEPPTPRPKEETAPAAAAPEPREEEPAPAREPEPAARDEDEGEAAPPQPQPAPKPAAEAPTVQPGEERPAAAERPAAEDDAPPMPQPKPSAKRVGRIDLAALGLIKSQQQQRRKGATFTDLRERETARRREQRQRQREKMRERRQGKARPKQVSTVERKSDVVLEPPVTVKSFATATGLGVSEVLGSLMQVGVMSNINAQLDEDTIELLAEEFEVGIRIKEETDVEEELMAEIQAARHAVDDSSLQARPPVIAFMGHVDHGKTSLIDAVRATRLANKEAGGITQHVGAYVAETQKGREVTILDTPGHAAFTAMRARGAQATDIAVLVVAADDGVMPQTEEAANHAKAAGTPIVVAINKVDAPRANPDQVRSQLAGIGLQPEDWGGDVGMIEVSALQKKGIDALLERVLLEAEVMDLKAHAKGDAMGVVLEAKLEKGKGKVATVLVTDGTLRAKDVVLAGTTHGKIRLMFDHNGKPIKQAGPSTPVEILGLDDLPPVGESFYVVDDLKAAKSVAEKRMLHATEIERRKKASGVTMQNLYQKLDESQAQRLRFVVKGDVQGSVEALKESLQELTTSEVIVDVIHAGAGGITESDVLLAETAGAVIIGFHVVPEGKARKEAERVGVEIRKYDVIYDLLEDVQKAIEGMLEPEEVEEVAGQAEVLKTFRSSRWGAIAGCQVTDGVLRRSATARVVRDGKVIYEAPFASLRHFKDDVREVKAGSECGIKVEGFDDIKVGDVIEAVEVTQVERTLEEVAAKAGGGDAE